jgi:hypothetical protein
MEFFHLSTAQRRRSNNRTKKNKMARKQSNELMKKFHKISKKKEPFIFCTCGASI